MNWIILFLSIGPFVTSEAAEDNSTDNPFVCNLQQCDWRNKRGAVTPIKSQGGCEACWAFSVVAVLETYRFNHIVKRSTPLSEQWLIDNGYLKKPLLGRCSNFSGIAEGGDTLAAFEVIRKIGGIYRTSNYPWANGTDQTPPKIPTGEPVMTGYEYSIRVSRQLSNDEMKRIIVDHGPVSAYMFAPDEMQKFKGDRIFACHSKGNADHALAIIGYGVDGSGVSFWLAKNSWGMNYGYKGYYKIKMDNENVEDCNIRQRVVWVEKKRDDDAKTVEEEPILKTEIIETIGSICFSLKPVGKCPRWTIAQETKIEKIAFTCLPRYFPETHHLVIKARAEKDITSHIENKKLTFVDTVKVHSRCTK